MSGGCSAERDKAGFCDGAETLSVWPFFKERPHEHLPIDLHHYGKCLNAKARTMVADTYDLECSFDRDDTAQSVFSLSECGGDELLLKAQAAVNFDQILRHDSR